MGFIGIVCFAIALAMLAFMDSPGKFFCFIPLAIGYYCITDEDRKAKKRQRLQQLSRQQTEIACIGKFLSDNGISGSHYEYPCNDGKLVMHESLDCMAYIAGSTVHTVPFSKIISINIDKTMGNITTSKKDGVVTRAVVGGVIGAATAGSTATSEEYVASASVKIHTNDLQCHTLVITADGIDNANDIEGIILALKDMSEKGNLVAEKLTAEKLTERQIEKPAAHSDYTKAIAELNNERKGIFGDNKECLNCHGRCDINSETCPYCNSKF